jgi:hypothetical protein
MHIQSASDRRPDESVGPLARRQSRSHLTAKYRDKSTETRSPKQQATVKATWSRAGNPQSGKASGDGNASVQSDHAKSKNREESRIACLVDRVKQSCPVEANPQHKNFQSKTGQSPVETGPLYVERNSTRGEQMATAYVEQSKNQLQKEARERAERISEARKQFKRERLHELATIFESAFGNAKV